MLKKDPLHIHDSWCDVNRNTPVLAKTKQDKTKKTPQFIQASKSSYHKLPAYRSYYRERNKLTLNSVAIS